MRGSQGTSTNGNDTKALRHISLHWSRHTAVHIVLVGSKLYLLPLFCLSDERFQSSFGSACGLKHILKNFFLWPWGNFFPQIVKVVPPAKAPLSRCPRGCFDGSRLSPRLAAALRNHHRLLLLLPNQAGKDYVAVELIFFPLPSYFLDLLKGCLC